MLDREYLSKHKQDLKFLVTAGMLLKLPLTF